MNQIEEDSPPLKAPHSPKALRRINYSGRALKRRSLEDLDFFAEDEADGVFVEFDVEGGALLEVFPHFFAVLGVDAANAEVGLGLKAGGDGVRVFVLFVAIVRAIGLNDVDVWPGDVADGAARLGGPKKFAGLAIDFLDQ